MSAPRDGGATVTFTAADYPEQRDGQPPTSKIKIDNVNREIPAKVNLSLVLIRDTFSKRIGGALSESVKVDVVPRVRKHRTLQRPLESWLSPSRRVLQQIPE